MSKHTPGPWKIGIKHPGRVIGEAKVIAYCIQPEFEDDINFGNWDEEKANARLIAAAPDFLEVCKAIIKWSTDCPPTQLIKQLDLIIPKVKQAIAKAEEKCE